MRRRPSRRQRQRLRRPRRSGRVLSTIGVVCAAREHPLLELDCSVGFGIRGVRCGAGRCAGWLDRTTRLPVRCAVPGRLGRHWPFRCAIPRTTAICSHSPATPTPTASTFFTRRRPTSLASKPCSKIPTPMVCPPRYSLSFNDDRARHPNVYRRSARLSTPTAPHDSTMPSEPGPCPEPLPKPSRHSADAKTNPNNTATPGTVESATHSNTTPPTNTTHRTDPATGTTDRTWRTVARRVRPAATDFPPTPRAH